MPMCGCHREVGCVFFSRKALFRSWNSGFGSNNLMIFSMISNEKGRHWGGLFDFLKVSLSPAAAAERPASRHSPAPASAFGTKIALECLPLEKPHVPLDDRHHPSKLYGEISLYRRRMRRQLLRRLAGGLGVPPLKCSTNWDSMIPFQEDHFSGGTPRCKALKRALRF